MKKLFYLFTWLTLLSAMGLMLLAGYWLFYPYKTTVFKNTPARVETKAIVAGEDITYSIEYCKYTDVMPIITKKFVDGIIYNVPDVVSTTKRGCGINKLQIPVPKSLPAGTYHLEMTYHYKVNPLREIDTTIKTEDFTVIK